MTTIAYRDGILAADHAVTALDADLGAMSKIQMLTPGLAIGAAGHAGQCAAIRRLAVQRVVTEDWQSPLDLTCVINAEFEQQFDSPDQIELEVMLFDGSDVVYVMANRGCWRQPVGKHGFALGSGFQAASGAMYCGASAEYAIEVAANFSTGTRLHGPADVIDFRKKSRRLLDPAAGKWPRKPRANKRLVTIK